MSLLRHCRCGIVLVLLSIAMLASAFAADEVVGPAFEARDLDGQSQSVRFVMSGDSRELRLSNGKKLAGYSILDRALKRRDSLTRLPLSRLTLANGDSLTALLLSGQEGHIQIQLPNGYETHLPLGAIEEMQIAPGYRMLVDSRDWRDDRRAALSVGNESRLKLMRVARLNVSTEDAPRNNIPTDRGQAVIWLTPPATRNDEVTLTFRFGLTAPRIALTVRQFETGTTKVSARSDAGEDRRFAMTSSIIRESEFCVRALLYGERIVVAVNHDVVATGPLVAGLSSIEINRSATEGSYEFGPSWVQAIDTHPPDLRSPEIKLDAVHRHAGDVLFGSLKAVTRDDIKLTLRKNDYSIPRREVVALQCGEQQSPTSFDWISGAFCRIYLQPQQLGPEQCHLDILTGAITAIDASGIEIAHPTNARLRLDWPLIRRIEPTGSTAARLIGIGTRHLGNSTRREFKHAAPDGIEWKMQIAGPIPKGTLSLSITASDLIPAGPQTLRGTPFLQEVRAGLLATKVFVNGTEVGTLNEFTSTPNWIGEPTRIVMPLDRQHLRSDSNVIALKQTSARGDATTFDDCELSNVMLEVK